MDFIKLLLQKSKVFYVLLVIISIINGLLNISILYFINSFVTQSPLNGFFEGYDLFFFCGAVLLSFLLSFFFHHHLIHITHDIVLEFEMDILKRVGHASFESFEKLGKERVFTAINDIRTLAQIPGIVMGGINASVIVVGSFIYMSMTSVRGTLTIMVLMILLLIIYLVRNIKIERRLNVLRDLQDTYYRYLHDFLYGFRELKADRYRNSIILDDYLMENRRVSHSINIDTSTSYMKNELAGGYSWHVVIGFIIFILPLIVIVGIREQSTFVLTILFMMGSVATLVSIIPAYTHVKIAIQRLKNVHKLIDKKLSIDVLGKSQEWENSGIFCIQDITYSYRKADIKVFKLGPVHVSVESGDILFVVGGNGSGKSTFVKLLSGLYKPNQGSLTWNGRLLNECQLRDLVAVVFSDPYLFSENYNNFSISLAKSKVKMLVDWMKLTAVVKEDKDRLTIDTDLSTGQRKRLALIYALMENKPILLLDEWAAEQDPEFRSFFYKKILKKLQEQGKIIIAVTHDDKYYDVATKIVQFEYGRLSSTQSPSLLINNDTPTTYRDE